jgi:hypothetical protein
MAAGRVSGRTALLLGKDQCVDAALSKPFDPARLTFRVVGDVDDQCVIFVRDCHFVDAE